MLYKPVYSGVRTLAGNKPADEGAEDLLYYPKAKKANKKNRTEQVRSGQVRSGATVTRTGSGYAVADDVDQLRCPARQVRGKKEGKYGEYLPTEPPDQEV